MAGDVGGSVASGGGAGPRKVGGVRRARVTKKAGTNLPVKAGAKAKGRKLPSQAIRRACFLEVLRRTANVSRAAREAGLATSTVYAQRGRSAGFAAEWDAAVTEALDALEEELVLRVRQGVEKPVFYGGQQVGSVRHYSDALAMFILKARRPDVYGRVVAERAAAEQGEGDEPSQDEARAEVLRRLARLGASGDVDGADGD
ncbi:hypothetical protein [Aquisediminimonas sediminicola]|uniref:hypothetical protein n=1 Tax=Alteraquisediminimonas sediminicola TaxID=2676787 RepID=UPI001C8E150F|nr:hypothetical protein [Aquisediminimonas sediminicola]